MRIPTNCIILFTIACTLLSGCSQSTTHGTVHGTVTLDGEKLKEGVVRFVPVDGSSQTASASIAAGEFTAEVPVGTLRVECSAPKILGQQKMYDTPNSPKVDVVGELLPARYNVRSELTFDVRPGSQQHAIELSSQ
jgi:hypothetical protein